MDNWETEFLFNIADEEIEGHELLLLISHMSIYCSGKLTERQKDIVDEVEQVLNFIYMRDKLDDAKNERLANIESSGDGNGTHTDN